MQSWLSSPQPMLVTLHLFERKQVARILRFSSEFLRERKDLYENMYLSRIIVGTDMKDECLVEADTVKLFANAYFALRVSYFNGLGG